LRTTIMPTIKLGPLGHFKLDRVKKLDTPLLTTCTAEANSPPKNTAETKERRNSIDDSPPPYTAVSITNIPERHITGTHVYQRRLRRQTADELEWCTSAKANKLVCRVRQLGRYLIEITALTLDADFDALNAALYHEKGLAGTNTILSVTEREELLALSRLVTRAHEQVEQDVKITEEDKDQIHETILEPAEHYELRDLGRIATELIGWYGEPLTRPIPWSETIPGHWKTHSIVAGKYIDERSVLLMKYLGILILHLALEEEQACFVLHDAFRKCCLEQNYGTIDVGSRTGFLYTPSTRRYSDLDRELFRVTIYRKRCKMSWGRKPSDCLCKYGISHD
jgi:hypothetical protein